MRNAIIRFCNSSNAVPYLASLGNEVVIRIDHEKCSDRLFIRYFCHAATGAMRSPKSTCGSYQDGAASPSRDTTDHPTERVARPWSAGDADAAPRKNGQDFAVTLAFRHHGAISA